MQKVLSFLEGFLEMAQMEMIAPEAYCKVIPEIFRHYFSSIYNLMAFGSNG